MNWKGVLQKVSAEVAINFEARDIVLIAVGLTRPSHSSLTFLRELQPEYWSCLNQFGILNGSQALSEDRNYEVEHDQLHATANRQIVPTSVNLHLRTIAAAIQNVNPQHITFNANNSHLYLYEMCGVVAILQRASLIAIQIFSRFSLASHLSVIGIL